MMELPDSIYSVLVCLLTCLTAAERFFQTIRPDVLKVVQITRRRWMVVAIAARLSCRHAVGGGCA